MFFGFGSHSALRPFCLPFAPASMASQGLKKKQPAKPPDMLSNNKAKDQSRA
jgi:hypothetical protein